MSAWIIVTETFIGRSIKDSKRKDLGPAQVASLFERQTMAAFLQVGPQESSVAWLGFANHDYCVVFIQVDSDKLG